MIWKRKSKILRMAHCSWLASSSSIGWLSLWHYDPRPCGVELSRLQRTGLAGYFTVLGSDSVRRGVQHDYQQLATADRESYPGHTCVGLLCHPHTTCLPSSTWISIRGNDLVSQPRQLAATRALVLCWPERTRFLASWYVFHAYQKSTANLRLMTI